MKRRLTIARMLGTRAAAAGSTRGQCDIIRGPVIPEAKAALGKDDVTPLCKTEDCRA